MPTWLSYDSLNNDPKAFQSGWNTKIIFICRYWEDPWRFNPDRFIENGSIIPPGHPNKQHIVLFGIGRRSCPGERFAKNRMFLLITMMLQKFRFLPADGEPKPQTDPHDYTPGFFQLEIEPYKVQIQLRN